MVVILTGLWACVVSSFLTGWVFLAWVVRTCEVSSFLTGWVFLACMVPLLDQVPESLLPAWLFMHDFTLDGMQVIALVAAFVVVDLLLSVLLLVARSKPC